MAAETPLTDPRDRRVAIAAVERHADGGTRRMDQDLVAVEAPLTIHVRHPRWASARALGLLMRTPGDDRELVLGLLHGEGVIDRAADLTDWIWKRDDDVAVGVEVTLDVRREVPDDLLERALATTSACGLCGRLEISRVVPVTTRDQALGLTAATITAIPVQLRARQAVFAETGGLHAAAFVDRFGTLGLVREDVGRHNAVDKLIGAWLELEDPTPPGPILAVSGRVAFEIVQKAARAGVAVIVAVGAPSSLAIEASRAAGITLIGFARDGRFNVYAGQAALR